MKFYMRKSLFCSAYRIIYDPVTSSEVNKRSSQEAIVFPLRLKTEYFPIYLYNNTITIIFVPKDVFIHVINSTKKSRSLSPVRGEV